ncbi:MAG: DUF3106 domain-containing protein [Burkholderiales bacterium]|nr:DUF3106 domain-containing protein [Burkholderiales bacterium]
MGQTFLAVTALLFALVVDLVCAAPAIAQTAKQPAWEQLTPQQKQVLAPLAAEWSSFPDVQRSKLLGIAQRFPGLSPDQKQRVQSRLAEWSKLTPAQRDLARQNFRNLKQLPPEKREEAKKKWDEYQQFQADQADQAEKQ